LFDQLGDPRAQRSGVVDRDREPTSGLLHHLAQRTGRAGDDRRTTRHGFDRGKTETFVA
jgi:hypothetical protein